MGKQLKSVAIIYGMLALVFLIMYLVSPSYRSVENIGNILIQCVPLAVVSLGQTIVIISGGIDMSVGSIVSVITCIAAVTMKSAGMVVPGFFLVVLAAVVIGAFNGIGVNYFKVPPMITTLSMMIILDGIALAILPMAGGKVHKGFAQAVMGRYGILSVPVVLLVLLFLVLRVFLYQRKQGTHIYAIGNHRGIAASMGVRVKKVSISAYIIAALCAAVTGILLASRMRIGDPVIGTSFGLDSITAAAIGGTALTGGVGLLSGTIGGAFLIGMISNMMNILGINHFYQYVLKGLLLVTAMIVYSVSSSWEVKKREY